MTDDLRTRAERAAAVEYMEFSSDTWENKKETAALRAAFIDGALWHAAQRPTREQIARAIYDADGFHAADTWDTDTQMMRDGYLHRADAVLALLTGDESDE